MDPLSLFTLALGFPEPWEVVDVACDPKSGRIDFHRAFSPGTRFSCPHCGAEHQPVHDTLERDWLHLNFFQFQAYIPMPRCPVCAAGPAPRLPRSWRPGRAPTAASAYGWRLYWSPSCKAMAVFQVAQLPGVSDGRVWRTLDHYVDQAHAQQENFLTVTSARSRCPACALCLRRAKAQAVAQFADALEAHGACAENICVVCMDMSASYQAGVCEHRPWAAITFDAFHVIQLVNKREPIKAVAKTLKKHWPSLLLNAFDSRLTNGRVEAVTWPPKPGPAATGPLGT